MTTDARRVVASAVSEQLECHGGGLGWLAGQMGTTVVTLRRRLDGRGDFTVTELAAIAAALDISPTLLVPPRHPSP